MKTYLDCIPCFFKQALEAARLSGAGPITQRKILNELAMALPGIPLTASPPEIGKTVYGLVKKITRKKDPYGKIKSKSNKLALALYGRLKDKVRHSRDSLLKAVELAIAGNIIDYGVKNTLNVEKEIKRILDQEDKAILKEEKRLFNYREFKRSLGKAETVLYLADNAGETVFDRILIEEINKIYRDKRIVYAVRGKPIINDALAKDARVCGIGKIAKVVSSGLDVPGTVLKFSSKNFRRTFKKAGMVISKGQGNFEALSSEKKEDLFFLFMAKCPVVAKHLSCNVGDITLLKNDN